MNNSPYADLLSVSSGRDFNERLKASQRPVSNSSDTLVGNSARAAALHTLLAPPVRGPSLQHLSPPSGSHDPRHGYNLDSMILAGPRSEFGSTPRHNPNQPPNSSLLNGVPVSGYPSSSRPSSRCRESMLLSYITQKAALEKELMTAERWALANFIASRDNPKPRGQQEYMPTRPDSRPAISFPPSMMERNDMARRNLHSSSAQTGHFSPFPTKQPGIESLFPPARSLATQLPKFPVVGNTAGFQSIHSEGPRPGHTKCLALPTDSAFLNGAHCFIRSVCIELFVSTEAHVNTPGKGARPAKAGQVGFRCIHCKNVPRRNQAKQATCYPSKRENIFESVRNFQRTHIEACPFIPEPIQIAYKNIYKRGNVQKRSQKMVRAYYAQAASEVGLVDTPHGLEFRDRTAQQGREDFSPLFEMRTPELNPPSKNKAIDMGKFEQVASESTKQVLLEARKEITPFVLPHDFPTISDFIFLLFHQLQPCVATPAAIKRRGLKLDHIKRIPGLCCKHCAHESDKNVKGMYFPLTVESLGDSSFSQTLLLHIMICNHVPEDIKKALTELKSLAKEHNILTKRGAKRKFIEKVWGRMEGYYKLKPIQAEYSLCSLAEAEKD